MATKHRTAKTTVPTSGRIAASSAMTPAPPSAPKTARAPHKVKPKPKPSASPLSDMRFMRAARPDELDYRDRPFRPNVGMAPAKVLFPRFALSVRHQGTTHACSGFALATVVEHLLHSAQREKKPAISPFMLYSMARRYDEFPGSVEDGGSSLRGALKGWFKHGACRYALFRELDMPPVVHKLSQDWWFDAVKRPLGAYYRIDAHAITDIHAALNEVGIVYASAGCHAGWHEGMEQPTRKSRPRSFDGIWRIPVRSGQAMHGGHAFAIVGYNEVGFLIHNSWGTEWGSHGYAVLTYPDWLRHAMDCWVAQLGVVTQEHQAISQAITLRQDAQDKVQLAASTVLRDREMSPFIVNMGHNGVLSNSGTFRTQPDDVRAIVDVHLAAARARWGLAAGVIDVCLYVHGGLVSEEAAAQTAAQWIPLLYDQKIFPVFLMWETDFMRTLQGHLEDAIKGVPRTTPGASLNDWWNERLERALARPGTALWREIQHNAEAMSAHHPDRPDNAQSGCVQLYRHVGAGLARQKIRMHLVAHSAGSVAASFMIDRLVKLGMSFESVSLMAPAVRVDDFDRLVMPHLVQGAVKRLQQFHLSEAAERADPSCGPYRRSLLYLVSAAFEGGRSTPILGMKQFFDAYETGLSRISAHVSPGPVSASTTHGGFDSDTGTQQQVLKFIRGV